MKKLKKLGKYEIQRELGRGAMGVVYEAFDPLIERTVAIKVILKSIISEREAEDVFGRFRREARAAGRLSHPKIVSIYEYGEDDDMAFIVMELIRGKELKEFFDHEDRFAIRDGIRIVMQLLDALDYSHARGVVHRDIKPANILITDDGQIKIADFGIAKIDSSNHTQLGAVLGTPTYMSPEQFLGGEVDHRADIYASGVILYQFLTGTRPFSGSVITIMHQAVHQEVTPPSQLNHDVSKMLDEVVIKAMAKRAEDRFLSAREFMEALKAAAQASADSLNSNSARDSTMVNLQGGFNPDETIVLPNSGGLTDLRREAAIEPWQRVSSSQDPRDFKLFLQKFPEREFAQLARLRIESLEKAAAQARIKVEQKKKEAAQRDAAERAKVQANALMEEEARRKREAAKQALLARKVAEIKKETEKISAVEAARRKKDAVEQARRAKELADFMVDHTKKFAEFVAERDAAIEAKLKIEVEAKLKAEAGAEE